MFKVLAVSFLVWKCSLKVIAGLYCNFLEEEAVVSLGMFPDS